MPTRQVGRARANPLRLDRRSDWTTTGASPFGLAFRGPISATENEEFWLYDALGPRIWIHRDNERFPERPLVFVLELTGQEIEQRRGRAAVSGAVAHRQPGELREIHARGPSAPSLPPYADRVPARSAFARVGPRQPRPQPDSG